MLKAKSMMTTKRRKTMSAKVTGSKKHKKPKTGELLHLVPIDKFDVVGPMKPIDMSKLSVEDRICLEVLGEETDKIDGASIDAGTATIDLDKLRAKVAEKICHVERESMSTTKRRKAMSMNSKTNVYVGLTDEVAFLKADQEEGEYNESVTVNACGNISTEAAIRKLRMIISYLETKGLPEKPTEEWVPMDLFSEAAPITRAEDPL